MGRCTLNARAVDLWTRLAQHALDRSTGKRKNFAFVVYRTAQEALLAVSVCNGLALAGHVLEVSISHRGRAAAAEAQPSAELIDPMLLAEKRALAQAFVAQLQQRMHAVVEEMHRLQSQLPPTPALHVAYAPPPPQVHSQSPAPYRPAWSPMSTRTPHQSDAAAYRPAPRNFSPLTAHHSAAYAPRQPFPAPLPPPPTPPPPPRSPQAFQQFQMFQKRF